MNQSLNSKAGVFTLITTFHLGLIWLFVVGVNATTLTPPVPLPTVMVQMLPVEQPKKQEVPQPQLPQPEPQPKIEPPQPQPIKETPKPEPKKVVPKKAVPKKAVPKKVVPKTTESDKALTAPKPEVQPAEPAQSAPVAAEPSPPATPQAPPSPPAQAASSAQPAQPAPPAPVTPPRFNAAYLNNPPPVYPSMLRRMGEEGRVLLRVLVTAEGNAGEVHVLRPSSSPLFDQAAITAVRKWRFVPARRGEMAIAEWVQVPIDFKLN